MSDVDWSVVAVETELEILRDQQKREEVSDNIHRASGSGCGCTSIIVAILVGLVGWRLLLEIIGILSKL